MVLEAVRIRSGYVSGEPNFSNLSSAVKTMLEELLNVINRDPERNFFYLPRGRVGVDLGAHFSRIRPYSWPSRRPRTIAR